MKKHFFYFLFLLAFMGCDKEMKEDLTGEGTESTKERDENNPSQDGKWEDVIGLSQKSAEFYWRGDTVTILTDGPSWWMNAVEVNGTVHKPTEEQKDAQIKGQEVILKYDWLTIRTTFKKIELIADLNEDSAERTFNLSLQSGDYFDHITGKQGGMLDGDWTDVIGLSQKSAEFYWRGDTVTILTDGPSWWMNAVEVNGTVHKPTKEQKDAQIKGQEVILKYDWLTIRTAFKKIELIADLNEDSAERTFNLSLQSGDYFDHITGKQGGMLDGDWTDVIGLSSKTAYLPAEGGSVKIQTKNEGWWFTGFIIEGTDIPLSWQEKQKQIEDILNFEKTFGWFTVKRNFKTIDLVVTPNHTGKQRTFIIKLQGGNYFDQIEGIQETK